MKSSTKHSSTCNKKGPPMKHLPNSNDEEDDDDYRMLNKYFYDESRKKSLTELVLGNFASSSSTLSKVSTHEPSAPKKGNDKRSNK